MKKYRIRVCLECEYDDIEAENEEDAFLQASEYAMSGGSWSWDILDEEEIEESEEEECD